MNELQFEKEWTRCVNDIIETYVPMKDLAPVRDEWILRSQSYIYESYAPICEVECLNKAVRSNHQPFIKGGFFVRESLDDNDGIYEAIPMSILKGPIVVKRLVVRTWYRIGADIDLINDPGKEYNYHIKYGQEAPVLDTSFVWYPQRES